MGSCAEASREEQQGNIIEDLMAEGRRTIDPFIQSLNMEILWAGPQEAEGVIYVDQQVLNPYGTVHGGCMMTLADSVAGHNVIAAGRMCVTLSSSSNFLRPANCKRVYCRSRIQKLGKQISVVAVEQTDEKGNLLMTGTLTFHTIKNVPPHIIAPREPKERPEALPYLGD